MAAIKVKIATGIMILQYQRSRFSKNCISAICPLCNIEPEDMTHFILKCEKLSSIRNRFMQELKSLLVDCNKPPLLIQELFDDKENLLHLIIDCTSYHFLTYKEQVRIETLTRGLCYKLYHKRLLLMSEGREFRKSFSELVVLKSFFNNVPIACLSGTLTGKHINALSKQLLISNFKVLTCIITDLQSVQPRFRLVFTTTVVGMGFDPPSVTQVIHCKPPRSLTNYLQEIGRAGRRGQMSTATLYYTNMDLAKNLPGIQDDILCYCRHKACYRECLLEIFGYKKSSNSPEGCLCCSFCSLQCRCENCQLVRVVDEMNL
ncbi:recQ [Mytilus edulis]|uniref:DNA 3'-5' helicase n=1 Tax=Mytilus edulis TaxID=6550 RepID=A0A8S3SB47_MYTED|nr:recQ [Mytilus edulis]